MADTGRKYCRVCELPKDVCACADAREYDRLNPFPPRPILPGALAHNRAKYPDLCDRIEMLALLVGSGIANTEADHD